MLVDTQYPLNQNAVPGPHGRYDNTVPESVVNKSGGNPNIALLTNITMETFFQTGNQSASELMENNPKNSTKIFGTESCIGCHSSAGIYKVVNYEANNKGPQLSGDFSWLLGKAKYNDSIAPPYPIHK
jgi:mono/diheme cytochrome c family protein